MAITISGQNNNDKILASDGVLDSISGFNVVGVMTAGQFDVTGKTTTNHISIGNNIHLGNAGIITATTLLANVTGNINHSSNLLLQVGGSEKFRVSSAGQLGIGGANYGSAGQVLTSGGSGSAATWSTIASDKITEGNTEAEVVDTGSDGHFKVTTEGSERLRITSEGNIGINVTPANYSNYVTLALNDTTGSTIEGRVGGTLTGSFSVDSLVTINAVTSIPIVFKTANTERARIKSNGELHIGTTNGNEKLNVHGAIRASGSSANFNAGLEGALVDYDTSNNIARFGHVNGNSGSARPVTFISGGTERLRIGSSGGVGISTDKIRNADFLHIATQSLDYTTANTQLMDGGGVCFQTIDNLATTGKAFPGIFWASNTNELGRARAGILGVAANNHDATDIVFVAKYLPGGDGLYPSDERMRIRAQSGYVGINETSPDSLLHLTTNSSTTYSTSEVNTVNSANALLRLENTNGGDGSGVNNYVGIYFRVANGANSDSQLQYVRTGDNAGTFHFKARNAGSTYPNLMAIKSDGNTGFNGTIDPKSTIHFGSNQDLRIGGQYGGLSQIMEQVEYTAGYTGTHWQFETNNMISWSFDGVLIVYGGGGSSYGSEVTKITIVYSRESGANNSGDTWRNGTTSYNIETLGHGQTGLSPSSGSLTVTEDTAPDGAASTRSLFKLGWSSAATGGSTTVWSKLHGTIYWGTGSSGDVEIQDKDGNIFWDSNP